MSVKLLTLGANLGGYPVQGVAHIGSHILVPVLVETERTARVLDKEIKQADLVLSDLRQRLHDLGSNEVGPARAGREGELLLEPHGHRYRWLWG